ncbi:BnaC06g14730D [Brassica napus]|uniref:BnaC06g14730D protein n=1 Tax=Brassica napus TaxID=3708 RepID=A0A078F2K4_BRANA|nr:BnaC06g14730D [Brassica napus]
MANSFVLLADLNACQCSFTVEVRLLRSWKARNMKSCGKLMGVATYYLVDYLSIFFSLSIDQHQTGVITNTSYAGAGSSVGRCEPKILNIRRHNYLGGDMPSATCINCNCSDGEKTATRKPQTESEPRKLPNIFSFKITNIFLKYYLYTHNQKKKELP